MDFMRLLKSFEELLYELTSWLVFYPITLWRTLRTPSAMMRYSDVELVEEGDAQYTDTLSPPIFLLLTLLIAFGIELSLGQLESPWVRPALVASDSNLLLLRTLFFSVFPLLMAVRLLRQRGGKIDRNSLKRPFYSQCYVAAPFAFAASLAGTLSRIDIHATQISAGVLIVAAVGWYAVIETGWFSAQLAISKVRAAAIVFATIAQATLIILLAALVVVLSSGSAPITLASP